MKNNLLLLSPKRVDHNGRKGKAKQGGNEQTFGRQSSEEENEGNFFSIDNFCCCC